MTRHEDRWRWHLRVVVTIRMPAPVDIVGKRTGAERGGDKQGRDQQIVFHHCAPGVGRTSLFWSE
jgi:hypothetical protein